MMSIDNETIEFLTDKISDMIIVSKELKTPLIHQKIYGEGFVTPNACTTISFINALLMLGLLNKAKQGFDLINNELAGAAAKGTSYEQFIIRDLPNTGHGRRTSSNTVEWNYEGKKAIIKMFLIRENKFLNDDLNNLLKSIELIGQRKGIIEYVIVENPKHAGIAYGINIKDRGEILAYDPIKGYKTEQMNDFIKKLKTGYLIILNEKFNW